MAYFVEGAIASVITYELPISRVFLEKVDNPQLECENKVRILIL